MFDDVAERYDLTNDVLSLGQDRRWRRAVARGASTPRPGRAGARPRRRHRRSTVEPFAAAGALRGRRATSPSACCGSAAPPTRPRRSSPGDALRLPFADDGFDAVTISFGLRNVADPDAALRELSRVTRPGGRLVVCEFSHPTWAPFRTRLHRVPDAGAAARSPGAVSQQPRRLRLPRRVDPGLARPGRPGRAGSPAPAGRDVGLAQPHRRHRRPAPRRQPTA